MAYDRRIGLPVDLARAEDAADLSAVGLACAGGEEVVRRIVDLKVRLFFQRAAKVIEGAIFLTVAAHARTVGSVEDPARAREGEGHFGIGRERKGVVLILKKDEALAFHFLVDRAVIGFDLFGAFKLWTGDGRILRALDLHLLVGRGVEEAMELVIERDGGRIRDERNHE